MTSANIPPIALAAISDVFIFAIAIQYWLMWIAYAARLAITRTWRVVDAGFANPFSHRATHPFSDRTHLDCT